MVTHKSPVYRPDHRVIFPPGTKVHSKFSETIKKSLKFKEGQNIQANNLSQQEKGSN